MSARKVDHDLLADYLGGALDGTPQEAVVAELVIREPAWAEAYALLAPAVAGVRADLAAWGDAAPQMPTDVTDRILAALADAPALSADELSPAAGPAATETASPADDSASPTPVVPTQPLGGSRRPGAARPDTERHASTGPDRGTRPGRGLRRRRWARLAGPVALGTAALVGWGAFQLGGDRHQDGGGATDTAASNPSAGAVEPFTSPGTNAPKSQPDGGGPRIAAALPWQLLTAPRSSGAEYTPESLAREGSAAQQFGASRAPLPTADEERLAQSGGLERLADQPALGSCLDAIAAEHGSPPLAVEVVDYARFQGRPALVVRFTDGTGARWAWVNGPECGVPGSGSDPRYRARVG
ncbi:hypothetical protein GA0070616_2583 [Micromonospora nigra]|uniref:Uncharacterized protein n=1 Tax=Micromonospora nigra TaxID=145857 RepID=A0A1C6S057_9ACTN|nr:hypothetical protein [Micromonospora nigra]SCL22680.1 hypothetical protein GA0070616_2583 [Micromonospora nigra]